MASGSVKTVEEYVAALPPDRQQVVQALRQEILGNLDADYEEGIQYGMIGYFVPHRVYPSGYHTDPKQPLPFAAIASQKGHVSLYLMGLYFGAKDGPEGETEDTRWFRQAWAKAGKRLDLGKSCVRIKRLDDVPLAVVGEAIRRIPARTHIARYEAQLEAAAANKHKRPTRAGSKAPARE